MHLYNLSYDEQRPILNFDTQIWWPPEGHLLHPFETSLPSAHFLDHALEVDIFTRQISFHGPLSLAMKPLLQRAITHALILYLSAGSLTTIAKEGMKALRGNTCYDDLTDGARYFWFKCPIECFSYSRQPVAYIFDFRQRDASNSRFL